MSGESSVIRITNIICDMTHDTSLYSGHMSRWCLQGAPSRPHCPVPVIIIVIWIIISVISLLSSMSSVPVISLCLTVRNCDHFHRVNNKQQWTCTFLKISETQKKSLVLLHWPTGGCTGQVWSHYNQITPSTFITPRWGWGNNICIGDGSKS